MPAVPRPILIAKWQAALESSGWKVLVYPPPYANPSHFRIFRGPESFEVRLYIWTLSPGGAGRPADEWRIQPTGISAFSPPATGKIAILGYEPTRDLFVGFDYAFHKAPLGASPSIQIKEGALDQALATGLGPYRKATGEVAVAFTPPGLGDYLANLEDLHKTGVSASDAELLDAMGADPESVTPQDVETNATPERRKVLQTILRALRDRRFRARVLTAYGHRCGMCDVQLGLIEAAHVLPVGHPDSNDLVTNGVALCAQHHTAYDRSLVTFDASFAIHLSTNEVTRLTTAGKADGLSGFKAALRPNLALPGKAVERPAKAMVDKANALRGWSF